MLCDRTGQTLAALSRSHLQGVIVTLATRAARCGSKACARTCRAWRRPRWSTRPAAAMRFAARCCYGLELGWPLASASSWATGSAR